MTEPSCPKPDVLYDPYPCGTPACKGPCTLWRIGRLRLTICQKCAGHRSVSDWELDNYLKGGKA